MSEKKAGVSHIYAEVAPAVPLLTSKRQTFTYRLPEKSVVQIGSCVRIPFGKRSVTGVVLELHSQRRPYPVKTLKETTIPPLSTSQITVAKWISDTLHGGLGFTLRLFMTSGAKKPLPVENAPTLRKSSKALPEWLALKDKPGAVIEGDREKRFRSIEKLANEAVRFGQVLILVPEKWMVEVVVSALRKKHSSRLYALHADKPAREQRHVWDVVRNGQQVIVVGTQKASLLPFQNLSLIVLEEEYIPAHKLWDQYPRLHNRDIVEQLARVHTSRVVYSGSFPSLWLTHQLNKQAVNILQNKPVNIRTKTIVFEIQDWRAKHLLPDHFVRHLMSWKRKQKKVLMLYNRRERKRYPLTRALSKLMGKYEHLLTFGTTGVLTSNLYHAFDEVVWLFPEETLFYPDYRTYENALSLLARLQSLLPNKGTVYVVTRKAQLLDQLLKPSTEAVVSKQLGERKRFSLPPFTDAVQLTFADKGKTKAWKRAEKARQELDKNRPKEATVLGPYQPLDETSLEAHLLLLGNIDELKPWYYSIDTDNVDLSPHAVL